MRFCCHCRALAISTSSFIGNSRYRLFLYIKPEARPIASSDPKVALCVADCRINVFESLEEAKKIWIKGQNFSISEFIGDAEMAKHFEGGSVLPFYFISSALFLDWLHKTIIAFTSQSTAS
jgi:phosphatidylserine decarboxylase